VSQADEFLKIDTPENVVFDYEVVGIGTRFIAAIIDTFLLSVLLFVVSLTVLFVGRLWLTDDDAVGWVLALFTLLNFALIWGYYIFFEVMWNGQSPGKRWAGIRVIRRDGTPITLTEAIIRNLVRVVDFLPFGYGVGIVTMFIHPQSARLGDLAAGTLVVREQGDVTISSLAERPISRGYLTPAIEGQVQAWPVERLTAQEIQLAADFLQRRHSLSNQHTLAFTIAQRLLTKMELPESTVTESNAATTLASIVKAYRERG
jgi:uncharacterized RDD family membrane protein YckC